MVYLISDGRACGLAEVAEVKSPYTTLAEAEQQAAVDAALGRTPLRIEDGETGAVLWEA